MQEQFKIFCENIKLTVAQREDAKTKYSGVCKKIHDNFYTHEYNGDTKLIFGSYSKSKNTAIRPMAENQDVDVLFKIPEETLKQYTDYKVGGQSALLQKIRDVLLDSKYSLSEEPRAWGKVILIKTADGAHNVELLPAYEHEDGTFTIPNTENGGSWDRFNPRAELNKFQDSNQKTGGLTSDLSRMIKRWSREVESVSIKSFEIENFVMFFLSYYDFSEKSYSEIVKDFFNYLCDVIDAENKSYVETARDRSKKAFEFEKDEKFEKATEEWKKVFGDSSFPSVQVEKELDFQSYIGSLELKYPSSDEEYLDVKYPIDFRLNSAYEVKIDASIDQNGWRSNKWMLSAFQKLGYRIQKKAKLKFSIVQNNVAPPYDVKWKVRNFGDEARDLGHLRGEISDGVGSTKEENTLYHGEHYVQCYIVKSNECVAMADYFVPVQ